jgi:indolepyruvate ferredoxin oxidoreductase, alpha subunit
MEVQFTEQIRSCSSAQGDTFHGEGILAITKALLQSGVAYVGGYQGAPVSHLLDVMVQAKPYLDTLGVHVEACSNEASAAAMLGASIHYPLRGAVTWKSIVGTNVAADALSNLASPGVVGGALIVVGEDYGEGASVIQERTHAYALKSTLALLDPRPDLANMVRMVEHGFASEASQHAGGDGAAHPRLPRARQLRGQGQRRAEAGHARCSSPSPRALRLHAPGAPAGDLPHEKLKIEQRIPAAQALHRRTWLNEHFDGRAATSGLIVQGGLYNALVRALQQLGLADAFGESQIPLLVLNVTYPLVPAGAARSAPASAPCWCSRRAARVHREGPGAGAAPAGHADPVHGKDLLPAAGEYTVEVMRRG